MGQVAVDGGFAGPVTLPGAEGQRALLVVAAVLRFRLYDIDLIIRRTLIYAVLTTMQAGPYARGGHTSPAVRPDWRRYRSAGRGDPARSRRAVSAVAPAGALARNARPNSPGRLLAILDTAYIVSR